MATIVKLVCIYAKNKMTLRNCVIACAIMATLKIKKRIIGSMWKYITRWDQNIQLTHIRKNIFLSFYIYIYIQNSHNSVSIEISCQSSQHWVTEKLSSKKKLIAPIPVAYILHDSFVLWCFSITCIRNPVFYIELWGWANSRITSLIHNLNSPVV